MHHEFFDQLSHEHQRIITALHRLEQTTHEQPEERERVFGDLLRNIRPHMQGEERTLYPALASFRRSHGHAVEALEQHHIAKVLLDEINDLSADDQHWEAKLGIFGKLIRHHIEMEESMIYDDTRAVLSDEQEMDIYRRYQTEREKARLALA